MFPPPVASAPAPLASTPALPKAQPAPLPLAELSSALEGAGLTLVQTEKQLLLDAQARMAAEPAPPRVQRERPILPPLDDAPLIQVETRDSH